MEMDGKLITILFDELQNKVSELIDEHNASVLEIRQAISMLNDVSIISLNQEDE